MSKGLNESTERQTEESNKWFKNFVLTWIARFGFFFSYQQIQPLFPLYLKELGASSKVIWVVMSLLTIAATAGRIPMGLLIDRYGKKKLLVYGICVFSIATLGYVWASSILHISFLRMLHGIGWAACTTAAITLAADIAPRERRGEMIGYAGVSSNLAGALGPLAGFAIFYRLGYQGLFLTAFIVGLVSLLFAFRVREPKVAPQPRSQRGLRGILVPESLLPAITTGFITFCHGSVHTFLPLYALEQGLKNPGLYFAVFAASTLLVRPVAGPLSDRISRRAVILPGYFVYLVGMMVLALAPSPLFLLIAAALTGLGLGAAHPAIMTLTVDLVPAYSRGRSLAQFAFCFDLGVGLGSITLGFLLDRINQNYSIMYLVATTVAAVGFVLYAALGKYGPSTADGITKSGGR